MRRPQPLRFTPVRRALARLLRTARVLAAALRGQPREPAPAKPVHPGYTIARTTAWLVALTRTLAGDTTWLIVPTYNAPYSPYRYPSLTADLRREIGLPAVPPRTEAQKEAAHRRYVKKIFATQPTGVIAARLARRLGLTPSSPAWPAALLAIPETPAVCARAARSKPAPAAPIAPAHADPPPDPPAPAAPHLQPAATADPTPFGLSPPRWSMA